LLYSILEPEYTRKDETKLFQGAGMDENALMNLVVEEKNLTFLGLLVLFALFAFWEWKAARREQTISKALRWPHNIAVALINTLLTRVILPGASLWSAYWAYNHGLGVFRLIEVPPIFSSAFTVLFLDWLIYFQHRIFHAVPLFWKFHRMHHTDLEVDVTTGVRFHPVEMGLSILFKAAVIILLGAPVFGVFLFESILVASSLFNHSNIRLSGSLDKILRSLIVTPDMHRVHHSVVPRETNSNFGFIFSVLDRIFGTYIPQPENGHEKMILGLEIFNEPKYLRVDQMLLQPFQDP